AAVAHAGRSSALSRGPPTGTPGRGDRARSRARLGRYALAPAGSVIKPLGEFESLLPVPEPFIDGSGDRIGREHLPRDQRTALLSRPDLSGHHETTADAGSCRVGHDDHD